LIEDLTIYLRSGTHRLTATLTLDGGDSGNGGYRVIYASYPGELAVLSAGQAITGWASFDGVRYRAPVPAGRNFRQLYVNNIHAQRARGPQNPGGFTRTSSGFTTTDSSMQSWRNISDIEFVIAGDWMANRCHPSSIVGGTITIQNPCWSNIQWSQKWGANLPDWIENAYELLDAPGEWYLDRSGGFVYYIPRSGEDMSTASVLAPVLENMIVGNGAHDISFENLTFSHSNWLQPDTAGLGYSPLQGGYHKVVGGALERMHAPIVFSASRNIIFSHNLFTHLGSRALVFEGGSQNIQVLANKFVDIAAGAIQFGGINDAGNTNAGTQNRGITIRDNLIGPDTNFHYLDSAEIIGGYVADMVVVHNEVADSPWNPVSIGWGWGTNSYSQNNQVTWNYLHGFSLAFSDSAAVYTLSPNPGMLINSNNMIGGGVGFGCVYPDEGSAYETWTANVCRQVPDTWAHLWTTSIHGNVIRDNWVDTPRILNNGANNDVSNNIVVTDANWPAGAQAVMAGAGVTAGVIPGPIGTAAPPPPSPPLNCYVGTEVFIGCYFDNVNFTDLVMVRNDGPLLNFNWGQGSPDPSIGVDTFSVKWEGDFNFSTSGTYRFTTRTDDGMRVYVDGAILIDQWFDQPATTYTADKGLAAGPHRVRVEWYENAIDAVAALSWTLVSQPPSPPPPQITIGARVQTTAATNVYRRSGGLRCTQSQGSMGTVTDGPATVNGVISWRVNFDFGCDGWAALQTR
jgi:hypothetical protein